MDGFERLLRERVHVSNLTQNRAPAAIQSFVKAVVDGAKPTEAAVMAGIPPDRAYDAAVRLLRRQDVRGMIRDAHMTTVQTELVPLALATQRDILKDGSTAPAAVRARAANDVLALGLREDGATSDALEQRFEGMTIEQVQAEMQAVARRILEGRAAKAREVVIDHEHNAGELFE